MKTRDFLLVLLLAAMMAPYFMGCSSSADRAEKVPDRTEKKEKEKDKMPGFFGDIQEAAEQMEQAAKDLQEGKGVEVVNFRELKKLLPKRAASISRTGEGGETSGIMGFKISTATGEYDDPESDRYLNIEINDIGGVSMLMMHLAGWTAIDIDREDRNSSERTFIFEGNKAYEKIEKQSARTELTLIIDDRFIVSLKGRNIEMDALKRVARQMSLNRLKSLG